MAGTHWCCTSPQPSLFILCLSLGINIPSTPWRCSFFYSALLSTLLHSAVQHRLCAARWSGDVTVPTCSFYSVVFWVGCQQVSKKGQWLPGIFWQPILSHVVFVWMYKILWSHLVCVGIGRIHTSFKQILLMFATWKIFVLLLYYVHVWFIWTSCVFCSCLLLWMPRAFEWSLHVCFT